MNKTELLNKLSTIRKGTLFRLQYKRMPTLTAAAKKEGITVIQYTDKVTRYGVQYSNIKRVQERKALEDPNKAKREMKEWGHWNIPNVLYEHNTTGKLYLNLAPIKGKGSHVTSFYIVVKPNAEMRKATKSQLIEEGILPNSSAKGDVPEVERIDIDNIVNISQNKKILAKQI